MKYIIDEVMFINADHVRIYLEHRHFDIVTNKGNALTLAKELLFPYFELKKLKTEEQTQVIREAA